MIKLFCPKYTELYQLSCKMIGPNKYSTALKAGKNYTPPSYKLRMHENDIIRSWKYFSNTLIFFKKFIILHNYNQYFAKIMNIWVSRSILYYFNEYSYYFIHCFIRYSRIYYFSLIRAIMTLSEKRAFRDLVLIKWFQLRPEFNFSNECLVEIDPFCESSVREFRRCFHLRPEFSISNKYFVEIDPTIILKVKLLKKIASSLILSASNG